MLWNNKPSLIVNIITLSILKPFPVGSSSLGTELCCHGERDYTDTQRSKAVAMGNINKDITMVLTCLQADMHDVLQRLNTLEALSASQVRKFVKKIT